MNLDNSSKSIDVSEFDIRKEMISESLKDKLIGRQQNIFSKLGNSIDNKFKFAEDVKGQGSASRYKRQNSSSRKSRQTTYKKKKEKNRELKELNMLERLNTKYEKHNQNVLPRSDIVLKKLKGWRKIKNISDNYRDDLQLLNMRKKAYYRTSLFCLFCKNFQKSTLYVLLMQATLLFHLIIFILYQARYQTEYYQNQQIKQGLLSFYIIDLCLTAFGYGLIANKYSLLRGYLNLYNLTLTILFYIYISSENIIDFSPLRQINMLIYVGYFIKGIEKMVRALQQSVKYILEAVAIVLLITTFFALIGMILFKGLSNYKCVDQHSDVNNDLTNSEHNDESAWMYCRVGNCPADQICQYQAHTIDLVTNFNDIFNSFFQVLKVISMDKWAKTMYFAFRSFNSSVWVYFVLMILVGGIFGFNMVIAILKTYYSHNVLTERKKQINEINLYTLKELDLLQLISNWSLALTNLSQLSPVSSLKRSQIIRQLATNKSQVDFNKKYVSYQRFKLKYLLLPNLWTLSQNNQSQNISSQVQDLEQLILINRIQQNQESFSKEASFPQFTSSSQQDVKQKDKDTKFNKSNKLPMQYKIKKLNTNQDEIENQIRLPVLYSSDRMQYFVIHKKFERKQTNQRYSNVKSYYRSSRIIQNRFFEIEDKFVRKGTNMSPIRHQGKFTVFRPKGLFLKINGAYQGFNAISKIINQKIKNTNQHKIDNYENLYKEIFQIDYKNQKKTVKISSISKILKSVSKINNIQASLNTLQQQRDFLIYIKGFKGIILILRKNVALLYYQRKLYVLFEFILLIYYISLCLQGDIKQQILDTIENITTIALLIEYFMKLVSLQEIKQQYLKLESSRKLQIVESIILFINFFDLAFGLVLHISDKNINLIKATKLLLFYRCLKYDKTAVIIGSIAQQTYKQYIYLGYLLLTVILTYALMGLEIFSHKFDEYGHVGQLNSFDDPFKAWLTVFNIMSHGDWYGILKIAAPTNQIFSFIYLFIIVFTLNYLVYGLVMAILLEAFNECLEVDHHQQKVHNNPLMLNIEEGIKYNDIGCKMTFNSSQNFTVSYVEINLFQINRGHNLDCYYYDFHCSII
ncbi:Sodium channel protein type 4 subunit alpha [Paramecium bursaria]